MSRHRERPTPALPPEEEAQRPPAVDAAEILANPYEMLGLSEQASAEDIKKAYFAKVREFPPEREQAMFKRIRAAYDALRTPEARAATDLFLLHPPVPYEPYKRAPAFDLSVHEEDWRRLAEAYSELGETDFRADFRDIKL